MQKIKEIFKDKDVYPEDVIVSALRLNVKLSHHHLSCLTYYYMVHPLRNQASFQFFPTYTDDIWGKSGIARVFNISSSFFQLIDSSNPQRLIPFSDFSISFKTLIDIGRTPFDLLIDPPAIFWEAFVYFDGSYELSPIYIKLPWDIIAERSLKNTMHKIYAQKQGHAAGIYKLPNLIKAFLKDSYIPTWKKIKYTLKLLEFYFFDTLWPVFFGFLAWLPALFVWPQFANMRLYYSSSRITLMISSLVFMNIFILIILCLMFLPKRKIKLSLSKVIGYVLQWFLIPFFGIFLTTIPALLVQIRLMKKSFAFKTAEPDKK